MNICIQYIYIDIHAHISLVRQERERGIFRGFTVVTALNYKVENNLSETWVSGKTVFTFHEFFPP